MTPNGLTGWILAALLLVPLAVVAQKTKEHTAHSESTQSPSRAAEGGPDFARVKERIITATNQFRSQEGRGDLRPNKELQRAAQYFADYLARTDKFSHTADGKEPWERAVQFGYEYSIVAENIAWEYNSGVLKPPELANAFVEGWKQSPEHRKNMLDPDLDEIGVAVAKSRKTSRYYAVQDFGRPKSKEITFKITNDANATVKYRVNDKEFSLQPDYTVTQVRSRPPKLTFATGEEDKKPTVYHPGKGDHYTVRKAEGGRIEIEED